MGAAQETKASDTIVEYTKFDVNTHVFNFRNEVIRVLGYEIKPRTSKPVLPKFIIDKIDAKSEVSMLLSSGDWVINGVSNVAQYRDYDIHVCFPEPASTPELDSKGDLINPLDENLKDAIATKKLICFVDYLDDASVKLLVETFKEQITHIDTLDTRISPTYDSILELLHTNAYLTKKILKGITNRIKFDNSQKSKSKLSSVKANALPNGGGFNSKTKRIKRVKWD
jgi:hypothetical protein